MGLKMGKPDGTGWVSSDVVYNWPIGHLTVAVRERGQRQYGDQSHRSDRP
jgi:hypothetical protein